MKIKRIIKRSVAALLAAITLVFVPVNGYQNAITCHAAAETAMFYALRALVEATTLSMGYSFQTQADLDTSTHGLENLIESYKNCDDFEDAAYLTGLLYMLEKKKIGDTIEISFENFKHDPINMISPYNCIQYLHNYLAMQFRKSGASYDDKYDVSLNEINSAIGSSNVKTRYCEITENVFKECLYDKQTYCTPESGMLTGGFLMRSTYLDESAKKKGCYKYWSVYFAAFPSVDFKSKDCPYILTCEPVNGVLKICCRNKSNGAIAAGLNIGIRQYDYFQDSPEGHVSRYTNVNYTPQYINASLIDTIYLDTRLYTSYAAYCAYAEKENSYAPALPVVGSTSVSSGISKNITITQTPTRTKEIEKTITEAREENPAITQDDLDEAVAKAIANSRATSEGSKDDNTSKDLSGIFGVISAILAAIEAMHTTVTNILDFASPINLIKTSVTSIVTSLTSYFPRVLDVLENLATIFPKDWTDFAKIGITTFPKLLTAIESWATTFPDSVIDFAKIGVTTFPKILDAIENKVITFPDVLSIPATLTQALADILAAVQSLVIVDTAVVNVSVKKLSGLWDAHLPLIPKLKNLISNISFSESFDYPVIKVGTPKKLRPYHDEDYIVLVDLGEPYLKPYFVWSRNIVRIMLWVGFAYSLFKHFRVRFHIA